MTHKTNHITQFLLEDELSPILERCSFCGMNQLSPLLKLQANPDVYFNRCINCFAVSASRMPTSEFLKNYYQNYYQSGKEKSGITFHGELRFAKHILKIIQSDFPAKSTIRLLDFGGGNAELSIAFSKLLNEKRRCKIEIVVVDFSEINEDISEEYSVQSKQDLSEIENDSFDIVFASAVIEHLPDAGKILPELIKKMNKNALLYIRTPWSVPLNHLLKKVGRAWDFNFPAHVHDLGKDFWENYVSNTSEFQLIHSAPSLVETTFRTNFIRTLFAKLLKMPWYVFSKNYTKVGGWEIVVKKTN